MKKQTIPKEYERIYDRTTCQRCKKPVSKKRMTDCKNRRFWPVCKECEKWIIPKYKEAVRKLQEKGFGLK